MRRFVWLSAFVSVSLFAVAAVCQAVAEARDRRRYPPPGTLVNIGGHRLHVWRSGQGQPTVILESGLSSPALVWSLVQPHVAAFTSVCSYDRAGYGWSDIGPKPRSAGRIADELHALLTNANVPGPYVFVGHSLGGLLVRVYAARHPADVAGLVLVDAAHEDQASRMPASPWRSHLVEELAWHWYRLNPVLARLGIHRWRNRPNGVVDQLPTELRPASRAIGFQTRAYDWIFGEGWAIPLSAEQTRRAGLPPTVPLVVVSAPFGGPQTDGGPADDLLRRRRGVWMDLQRELVGLSPLGVQVLAEGSGHMVHLDQPDVVVEAIRRVVEMVRMGEV